MESKPKRVLIAYSSRPPIIKYLEDAFQRVGVKAQHVYADENTNFDRWVIHRVNKFAHSLRLIPKSRTLFSDHPKAHRNFRSNQLSEAITKFNPDLLMVIRGISFDLKIVDQAPVAFGWWIEREERISEALKELKHFDHYYFMNSLCVDVARESGYAHASYLHHSVDPTVFKPLDGVEKDLDFCFVGNWSPKRQKHLDVIAEITPNGVIYGGKWLRKNWNNPTIRRMVKGAYIEGDELVSLYNRSKIVLNVTNWGKGEGKQRSGMNMRILEVPATGSFLLTDSSLEMDSLLTPGVHVATYEGLDEFRAQFVTYLSNEAGRHAIATEGMNHIRSNYSYDKIAEQIIHTYEEVIRRPAP